MAKELDESERISLNDLEENFIDHVRRYRNRKERELAEGKRETLEEELINLEEYLEGCRRSEIDDVRINIDYCGAKVNVLKTLLEK